MKDNVTDDYSDEPGELDSLPVLVARSGGLQPWRRVFHACFGVALAATLYLLRERGLSLLGLGVLLAVLLSLDALRLTAPHLNRLFFRQFQALVSPREEKRIASSTWYVLGGLLLVGVFPLPVAVSAILVLALADPTASYMGRRWGKRKLGSGTVLGSSVFLLVALLVLTPFLGVPRAALAAAITAVVEALPIPLDDNLTVPLAAGTAAWLASLM